MLAQAVLGVTKERQNFFLSSFGNWPMTRKNPTAQYVSTKAMPSTKGSTKGWNICEFIV
jgi:hypothetical protein